MGKILLILLVAFLLLAASIMESDCRHEGCNRMGIDNGFVVTIGDGVNITYEQLPTPTPIAKIDIPALFVMPTAISLEVSK